MVWRSLILFRKQTPRSRFGQLLLKQTIAPQLQISKKQGGREIKRYWQCSQTVKLQKEYNSPTEFIAEILCRGLQLSRGAISVSTGHLRGELRMSMIKLKQYQHPARKFWRRPAFSNKERSLHIGIRLVNFTQETTGNKGKSAFRCFILCPNQDHRRTENFIQIFQTVPAKSADAASGSKTTLREPDNRSV